MCGVESGRTCASFGFFTIGVSAASVVGPADTCVTGTTFGFSSSFFSVFLVKISGNF